MKTFSDRWRQLEWDDIRLRINGKTAADVERALNASRLNREDMMALLSPAAADYLEPLAQRAQRLTRQALWQYRQLLRAALSLKPLCQRLHLLRLLDEQPHQA
ncbi:thiamine biosynthesis protein ThiH [Salmonella enterica subsp. enterica]|uniref:Thiamine biosynthesis protein ThiH n=1 Tax=Salmonella enterica I TaxID=59201 RepID=A0A379VYN4_SALET|nr:thiamine biosynthesis protein ThiH [Salmonella enterica subsp. enterica]